VAGFLPAESINESSSYPSLLNSSERSPGAEFMNAQASPVVKKMVFRHTNRHMGRCISVTPENSTNKHLSYGRIILNRDAPSVSFNNGNQETGLICLSGAATVKTGDSTFTCNQYDSVYIPRDSRIDVSTTSKVDIAEFCSDVDNRYPLQFVSYAELSKDPSLSFNAGTTAQARRVNI